MVPGAVHQRDGQRLLPGGGQKLVHLSHCRIMLLGKRLHLFYARDRPRMLPEIEIVFPFLRRRHHAVDDFDVHKTARVYSRLGFCRNIYLSQARPANFRIPFHAVVSFGNAEIIRMAAVFDTF